MEQAMLVLKADTVTVGDAAAAATNATFKWCWNFNCNDRRNGGTTEIYF